MRPNSHILPHPPLPPLSTTASTTTTSESSYMSSIPHQQALMANPPQQLTAPPYTNDLDSRNSKRPKVRKPRACDLCRKKKIRCDYDPSFPENQCSSCRGYKKTCDFAEAAKKRGPPKGYVEGLENRIKRMEHLLMTMASSSNLSSDAIRQYINNNTDEIPTAATSFSGSGDNNNNGGPATQQHVSLLSSSSSSSSSNQHILSSPQSAESTSPPSPPSSSSPPPSTQSNAAIKRLHCVDETQSSSDALVQKQLANAREGKYAYLGSSSGVYMLNRLFPPNAKDDSIDAEHSRAILQGKEDDVMVPRFENKSSHLNVGPGANDHAMSCSDADALWILPPKPVVDRLVELYFTKMNIFLPIVDEDEFMAVYRKEGGGGDDKGAAGTGTISKPLLMTICRVTIRMLPADDPVVQHYQLDRTAMFWDLVRQLETNYELDFMEPKIECIQMLLLSSANADRWSPKSANWLATSIAVKMAQDLGLHRSNSQWTLPCISSVEARKRLWWSAYVVDRWVCASLGRPLTVNDADCDLEYPELGDDGKYTAFVAIIKLSGVLGDVLRAVCSPRARKLGDQGLGPERVSIRIKQALLDWKQGLPPLLWLDDEEMDCIHQQKVSKKLESKINSGAGQLRILYIAVQLLSKRPSIFLGSEPSTQSTVIVPQECLDAVVDVLDIFYIIKFQSLMDVGWSLSSYGLSQTLMFIFLNHRNTNEQVVAEAKRQAESFKQHYRKLEDHFIEASLITFLDAIGKMIEDDQGSEQDEGNGKEHNGQAHNGQASSLWGTSSGMDWHDMMDLISE